MPIAHRLDRESALLFETFWALGRQGLLLPKAPDVAGRARARYSGILAVSERDGPLFWRDRFFANSASERSELFAAGQNEALRQAYLPAMAAGKRRVGVGFSQLRRQPAPLTAQPVTGGYQLRGEVPWVTGAGLFEEFIGAAVLESGEAVFGLLPLVSSTGDRCHLTGHDRPLDCA